MSTGYQLHDKPVSFFLTFQVFDWVDLPIGRLVFLNEKFIEYYIGLFLLLQKTKRASSHSKRDNL